MKLIANELCVDADIKQNDLSYDTTFKCWENIHIKDERSELFRYFIDNIVSKIYLIDLEVKQLVFVKIKSVVFENGICIITPLTVGLI